MLLTCSQELSLVCFRELSLICIGIVFAWILGSCEDTNMVEKIRNAGNLISSVCITLLAPTKEPLRNCQFFGELVKGLLSSALTWCVVFVVCFMCPITIAAYMSDDTGEKSVKNSETVQQEEAVLAKRNGKAFVWEEDIYINDLSEYYDGEIAEKDEVRYISWASMILND